MVQRLLQQHHWGALAGGKMSHDCWNMLPVAQILRPAENDEIYLESRSSELLLRNGISDISEGQQWSSVQRWHFVLRPDGFLSVTGICLWTFGKMLWSSLPPSSVFTGESVCYTVTSSPNQWRPRSHPVSFMMTPAHVLRLVSTLDLKRWTHWCCLGNKGKTCWGYQQSEWEQA